MKKSYFILNNGRLRRKNNTLYFENDEGTKIIPVNDVEDLKIYGELDINTNTLNFLAQNKIPAHIFNYYGYYSGSFFPREKLVSGYLIIKQVEHYLNDKERIYIARELIYSASYNIIKNIKQHQAKHVELKEYVERIQALRDKLVNAFDIPTIMGVEGNIRNIYYETFDIITNKRFSFSERVKRPPNNPMNAMISFGNSLLYTAVLSEIYNTQLNPAVSFLHEPVERRFSLSLDIAEIFKPIIIDRLIFRMVNDRIIQEDDFMKDVNYCYLNEKGRKKYLKEFDEKMNSTIHHKNLDKNVSYKTLIRLELYKLIKHITGMEKYEGFKMWW
ncbi:MAG TPA: type I-B CRISPR-associated endonuclease Cas1 [Clostridiales bacterium]|nr:type I-B CRISPR-associated endonuclease Cas1 [Clostridiales bacterium]